MPKCCNSEINKFSGMSKHNNYTVFCCTHALFKRRDKDADSSSAFIGTRITAQSHSLFTWMASLKKKKKQIQKEWRLDIKYTTLEKLRRWQGDTSFIIIPVLLSLWRFGSTSRLGHYDLWERSTHYQTLTE